jgi:hypothetical protein
LEPDIRYYRRRACEEMSAAARAITPAARQRRLDLVGRYLERLKALDALPPFDELRFAGMVDSDGAQPLPKSAFVWSDLQAEPEHA